MNLNISGMKSKALLTTIMISLIFINCQAGTPENENKNKNTSAHEVVLQLTTETFKKVVYNYDLSKAWKYEGSKPAIIDFYADWCPPCRQLSPLVEEIAREYEGKIVVYKVNADLEKVLVRKLGISSLPTLLYIPAKGAPEITVGLLPKETLIKNVNDLLLTK
jgi:thioredoxin 1